MASNKRKQDEKHLKMLREMVSLPSNKQCFDCHQRGPTYVNMTIGSFVCTSCSGILRGLNPPHRVKSISMASFTPEEMDFLKSHGNELNRKVYLGLYDSRSWPEPDSRDEQRVRDYMVQKYENKRWYVAPTEAMKEEAKRANEAALNSKPQVKPLRSLLGENAPKLTVGSAHHGSHPPPIGQPHAPLTVPAPGAFKPPPTASTQVSAPPTTAPAKPSSGFDLLGDLGGDPFASNVVASNNHGDSGGFADFSNFDNMSSAPSHPPASAPSHVASTHVAPQPQAFPISSTPLQPFGLGQAQPQAQTPTTAPQPPAQMAGMSASDRYAALADLDSAFSAPTTTATSINWGGMEGGSAVNWGGTSSAASTPSQSTPGGLSWNTTTTGAGGQINWGSQSSAGMPMGNTPPSGGFGAPSTAANPFGGGANPGMTAFTSAAPSSTVNPFGAAAPSSMPMTQFSQAGGMVAGMPASSVAGFGGQFVVPGSQPTSFGQFPPMQNGGFGMTATSGYGGAPAFSQQQFMMPTQPAGVQQAGAWGQMGAMPQGSQPVANPFMNTAMHQQVPPPSGSTNPFL